jgi:anaerobic sulfite reductase subunit A
MDYMYLKNSGKDSYYEKLKTKLKFALLECRTSFENCFCASMGTNQTDDFSLAVRFSEEGGEFLVKDDELTTYFDDFAEKSEFHPEFVQDNPTKVKTPDTVCDDPNKVRKILTDNDMWNQYDKRCIACGRCDDQCPHYISFSNILNKMTEVVAEEVAKEKVQVKKV